MSEEIFIVIAIFLVAFGMTYWRHKINQNA